MLRKTIAALAGLGLAATVACGAPGPQAGPDEFVIGAVVAKTGMMEQYDVPALATAKVAIEHLNEQGGIDGRKVRLIEGDYKSDRTLGPTVAQDLIDQGAEAMLISCDYDYGSPAAITAQQSNLFTVSLCAASSKFGPIGGLPLGFSASPTSAANAAGAAQWAVEEQGWKTAYVFTDPSLRSLNDWSQAFKETYRHLGGEVIGEDSFLNSDPSISAQITKYRGLEQKPDTIVLSSVPPGGASALRQIRASGIEQPVILTNGMDTTGWLNSVPDLSGTYVASYIQYTGGDENPKINEIVAQYTKATGAAPTNSYFICGYVAVQIIAAGVEGAESSEGDVIAEYLESGIEIDTLLGPVVFSYDIHALSPASTTMQHLEGADPKSVSRVVPSYVPTIK